MDVTEEGDLEDFLNVNIETIDAVHIHVREILVGCVRACVRQSWIHSFIHGVWIGSEYKPLVGGYSGTLHPPTGHETRRDS